MRPGNLQDQVPWTNAFWFVDREARQRLTKGFLANKGRSVLRLRRTDRTRIIAESQGNGGFSLADSQSPFEFVLRPKRCRDRATMRCN